MVGVLGGMGPEATADLFLKIIRLTPAARDQDHLRILIDNHPQIPDRTAAILGRGPDPTPALVASARLLERMGAQVLAMPCNTAHHFHAAIQAALEVPLLHMMLETAAYVAEAYPSARRVGLLATDGTLAAGLYQRALAGRGLRVLTPEPGVQERLMAGIYAVKAGDLDAARPGVLAAARALADAGCDLVVLGCTEVPLAVGAGDVSLPLVDATWVLARATVREALGGEG